MIARTLRPAQRHLPALHHRGEFDSRIALAPIIVLAFGIGDTSKIVTSWIVVVFLVFFNTFEGARSIDEGFINAARLLGASEWQITRTVVIPSTMAWVFASLSPAISFALIGVIVGEFIGAERGIGRLIIESEARAEASGMMVAVIVLMLVGVALSAMIWRLQAHLLRWQQHNMVEIGSMESRLTVLAMRGGEAMKARCCIVGGGPAGMMLGYLLGRAGVDVVVLEKHADFFRDFRGDTVHPSTLAGDGRARPARRIPASCRTSGCSRCDGMFGGDAGADRRSLAGSTSATASSPSCRSGTSSISCASSGKRYSPRSR